MILNTSQKNAIQSVENDNEREEEEKNNHELKSNEIKNDFYSLVKCVKKVENNFKFFFKGGVCQSLNKYFQPSQESHDFMFSRDILIEQQKCLDENLCKL